MTRVLVTRRLPAAFVLAALLFGFGFVASSGAAVVAGAFVLGLALFGPRLPRRLNVEARVTLGVPLAVEEDEVPVRIEVTNRDRRGALLEVRTELPGPSSLSAGTNVEQRHWPGRATVTGDFTVRMHLFGLQRVGPVDVRLQDPFGFAAVEHRAAPATDLRVQPRRDAMREAILRAKQIRAVLGRYDVAQPGNSFEFYGLRDYHAGDRPRDVNWKASARVGALIVNQHQRESDAEVVLIVDVRASTRVGILTRSPFAQSCRAAVSVGEAHLKARDAVRFVAYGRDLHEDRHTGATRRIQGLLDLVVGLEPAGAMSLADTVRRLLPTLRRRSPILIFTPLVDDPTVQEAVGILQAQELPASIIAARPDWGPGTRTPEQRAWDARQKLAVRGLRRLGVPVAVHAPGVQLAVSLETLEVRA